MPKVIFRRDFSGFKTGEVTTMSAERTKRLVRAGIVSETAAPPNTGDEGRTKGGALKGVDFASDEAAEFAAESNLVAADFEGVTPSGANGYTKADVRHIAALHEE